MGQVLLQIGNVVHYNLTLCFHHSVTHSLTHSMEHSPSYSLHFFGTDGSLPHSQVPAICPFPEPAPYQSIGPGSRLAL